MGLRGGAVLPSPSPPRKLGKFGQKIENYSGTHFDNFRPDFPVNTFFLLGPRSFRQENREFRQIWNKMTKSLQ